jgi:predicted nucleotidyltransferase
VEKMKNKAKTTGIWDGVIESSAKTAVLIFLSENPERSFTGAELAKKAGKSRMSVFLVLKTLSKEGAVKRESRGGAYLYRINAGNPSVKQFKVLKNVIELEPFLEQLKKHAKKIVLFGSLSRGEDTADSDVDLLVVTNSVDEGKEQVKQIKAGRKIEAVFFTPSGLADLKEKEKVFYGEIERGLTLWEGE